MKEPVDRLVSTIGDGLKRSIPIAFRKNSPKNENDLNDKINSMLVHNDEDYRREHPAIAFALTKSVPDHSFADHDLLIETKYIRNSTTPSVASSGIAEDLTKYPEHCHKLFIVYDPNRQISDDETFQSDFENKGNCTIRIIR